MAGDRGDAELADLVVADLSSVDGGCSVASADRMIEAGLMRPAACSAWSPGIYC
jgi:hypothetical protein